VVGVTPQVTLQGKTGDGSRHSFTYSTNHENSTEKPQRRKTLTERENVTLREEVRDWGSLNDWPLQWDESIEEFIEYDREARKTSQVYENQATGETSTNPVSHRFQPQYREMQYARFNDLLREAQDRHSVVHTTLIGLTASSTPDGEQLAPVDHWHDLDRSNDAVKQAIRRIKDQLGDAVAIEFVEAHPGGGTNDGYLHKHPVIISGQRVSDTQVRKILNAHVNNSPHAKAEAHDLDPLLIDTMDEQHPTDGFGATLAEGEIVLPATALVGMAFQGHLDLFIALDVIGVVADELARLIAELSAVEFEKDPVLFRLGHRRFALRLCFFFSRQRPGFGAGVAV